MEESPTEAAKPDWLRVRMIGGEALGKVRETLRESGVRTVCDSSRCPNIFECWGRGTATFMILGERCTRACRFCAVPSGDPQGVSDPDEPRRVAQAVARLGLGHAVITSVARDDLEDGGAGAFAATVLEVRRRSPGTTVELLVPDMAGDEASLRTLVSSRPEVIGHNLEVVRTLQSGARDPRAGYRLSLDVLRRLKELGPGLLTKTSLMLGLGESREEVMEALSDAREADVDLLTLGQYLRPKGGPLPVLRYIPPQEFEQLRLEALELGFRQVMSGPLVRSSYHANEMIR